MDKKAQEFVFKNEIETLKDLFLECKDTIEGARIEMEGILQKAFLLRERAAREGVPFEMPSELPVLYSASTLRQKIEMVLTGSPLYPIEIINQLKAIYPDTKKQTVYVMISRLKEEGMVVQGYDRRYSMNPDYKPAPPSTFGGSDFI